MCFHLNEVEAKWKAGHVAADIGLQLQIITGSVALIREAAQASMRILMHAFFLRQNYFKSIF